MNNLLIFLCTLTTILTASESQLLVAEIELGRHSLIYIQAKANESKQKSNTS